MLRSSEQLGRWSQEKVLWPSLVVLFLFGPGPLWGQDISQRWYKIWHLTQSSAKRIPPPSWLCLQAWGALAPNQAW